jgi:uncharacterized protein (DUF1800 family)
MAGSTAALHAINRFGLGARPGELRRVLKDPRDHVRAQLDQAGALAIRADGLPSAEEAIRANRIAEMARERERARQRVEVADMAAGVAAARGAAAPASSGQMTSPPARAVERSRQEPQIEQSLFRAEAAARFNGLLTTETPLLERMVLFWSNHFCVSVAKGGNLRASAGAFEREAIRPHVLGRFPDMLKAVATHPAMLFYLDNNVSTGPNSRAGRAGRRGLNENFARELLELHTLGVDGGYVQEDVTTLARILTGWTVTNTDEDLLYGGRFTFAPARHEPGSHTVLGVVYGEGGPEQGFAALQAMAAHPSTARHIARKIARHFVADEPPPSLVARLEQTFRETQGDLARLTRALVDADEAWDAPPTKLRLPLEWVTACLRSTGRVPETQQVLGWLNALGQPTWQPPGPNGFPDRAAAWISPEGVDARLDLAAQWARLNATQNPRDLLDEVLGPCASAETRQAVARAESRQQGLAILFMSPEFQRR